MPERIYPHPRPTIGVVVGTFAAVPYVHLHLESRRRHCPSVPLLVSDDASPYRGELAELCRRYGADFSCNPSRGRWTVGDLSVYVKGLEWAQGRGLDILVKMSRRFVPLCDWVPGLQALAYESQMPTFSQLCRYYGHGFRTECVAFHAATWCRPVAYDAILGRVRRNEPVFVEGFVHQIAREVAACHACPAAREYTAKHPRPPECDAYAPWDLMPERRTEPTPRLVWHQANDLADYALASRRLGLPYEVKDFSDPNQGCGFGEP